MLKSKANSPKQSKSPQPAQTRAYTAVKKTPPLESVHTMTLPLGKYRLSYAGSRRSIALAKAAFIPLKPSAFRVASGLHMEEPVLTNQEDFLLIDCLQDQAGASLVITAKNALELKETKLSLQRLDVNQAQQPGTSHGQGLAGKPVRLLNKADRYLPLKVKTQLENQSLEAPDALSWCVNPELGESIRGFELYWAEGLPIAPADLDIELRLFYSKTQQTEAVVTASIGRGTKVPRGKAIRGIGLTLSGRKASSFELRWQAVFRQQGYSERLLSGEICRGDDLIACRLAVVIKPDALKVKAASKSKPISRQRKTP
jgi:hypothetical protein